MRRWCVPFLLLLVLAGCGREAPEALDLDLYSDRGFAARVQELLADAGHYEGVAVRLTGAYHAQPGYAFLLREGPDGPVGLELSWQGEAPPEGQQTLAVGRLECYEEAGVRYLQVAAELLFLTGNSEETIVLTEQAFVSSLAALYDAPEAHLGAKVTLTGQYVRSGGSHCVTRQVQYTDGRTGIAGLAFLPLDELPREGAWVTVTGTLCADPEQGETRLTLVDAVIKEAEELGPVYE